MKAFVYILKSLTTGGYYVGSTTNIPQRLKHHNGGNVTSTKAERPYDLVFSQEFINIRAARKVENKIKSWKRRDFVEKIVKDGIIELRA